jgi:hypothetical protein
MESMMKSYYPIFYKTNRRAKMRKPKQRVEFQPKICADRVLKNRLQNFNEDQGLTIDTFAIINTTWCFHKPQLIEYMHGLETR